MLHIVPYAPLHIFYTYVYKNKTDLGTYTCFVCIVRTIFRTVTGYLHIEFGGYFFFNFSFRAPHFSVVYRFRVHETRYQVLIKSCSNKIISIINAPYYVIIKRFVLIIIIYGESNVRYVCDKIIVNSFYVYYRYYKVNLLFSENEKLFTVTEVTQFKFSTVHFFDKLTLDKL